MTYRQFFKYKSSCAHKLYPVFICNQILAPLYPTLEQGNYLWYQVQPALPDGIIIDPNTGVITGKPLQPTKSEIYTVSATNRKDSVQVKIAFATSNSCQSLPCALHAWPRVHAAVRRPLCRTIPAYCCKQRTDCRTQSTHFSDA